MPEGLSTIVALIVALSIASERLVEIIKGFVPGLNIKKDDVKKEGQRTAILQIMAVGAGIVTACLCWPVLTKFMPGGWTAPFWVLALGLLASGGSGFWNSVMTYILKLKDVKAADAKVVERELRGGASRAEAVNLQVVA